MSETWITIQQGDPVVAETEIVLLGTGSAGDPGACRRLAFPGAAPLLAPIVYQAANGICLNPHRTLNLDNDVLVAPITQAVLTLTGTKVIRYDRDLPDCIVTEIWTAQRGASMPTFFLRLLYEYLRNAPKYALDQTEFITWEPRDRNAFVYNVELLSLRAGSDGDGLFDVQDRRFDEALADLSVTPSGLIDAEVRFQFRIVSKVEA